MHASDAHKLEVAWGDKPCNHPDIIAESGSNEGGERWRCTQCGRVCDVDEWMKKAGIKE
jgi:hypothetical protein